MNDGLRAIADSTRRRILHLVWNREMMAGDIAARFDVSRPAISQHLRVLLDAGLVVARQDGTRRFYRADSDSIAALRTFLTEFWDQSLARLKVEAEKEQRRYDQDDTG